MPETAPHGTELVSVILLQDWSVAVHISLWVGVFAIGVVGIVLLVRLFGHRGGWRHFEINEAEIGTGTGKLRLRPNMIDRQVAYAVWVELSTRKIGLPIDFDHDVIAEVYDSWYGFFAVTRELIKSIPVAKVRGSSTQKIVKLSIEVLNGGLRPHLTKWQARFRRWYENELNRKGGDVVVDPQEIQKQFPKFEELKSDMERVNQHLMNYRERMYRLVMSD